MMESKYKERAREIWLIKDKYKDVIDTTVYKDVIEAMCQLAEEVEKVYTKPLVFDEKGNIQKLYSKAYVEELLQKQRELCAYKHEIDRDSILNAKLKIY